MGTPLPERMFMRSSTICAPIPATLAQPTFFGWARVAGIGAQIVDERVNMRSGKGVPIYRPKYFPEGQELRHIE